MPGECLMFGLRLYSFNLYNLRQYNFSLHNLKLNISGFSIPIFIIFSQGYRRNVKVSNLRGGSDNTRYALDERDNESLNMTNGADPCLVFSPGHNLPGEGGEKLSAGDLGIRRCLLRYFTKLATAAHSSSESESP